MGVEDAPNFSFSFKIPRTLTHRRKFKVDSNFQEELKFFLNLLTPLADRGKLGILLFQFPPSFKYDEWIFEELLSSLPGNMHFSVEFRDSSWIRSETFHMLDKYDVAYTIVDEPLIPPICEYRFIFIYSTAWARFKTLVLLSLFKWRIE